MSKIRSLILKKTDYNQRGSRRVIFDSVHIYHFERTQGYICIPNNGGCSLGMKKKHWKHEKMKIIKFHLLKMKIRLKEMTKRLLKGKLNLPKEEILQIPKINAFLCKLLKTCPQNPFHLSFFNDDGGDTFDIYELERRIMKYFDYNNHLQPISLSRRRIILKRGGCKKFDDCDREKCEEIRTSRMVCGCSCVGACYPATCECFLNGIKCQVDHYRFPCPCSTPSKCFNSLGRVNFDSLKARTHFLHTKMRLMLDVTEIEPIHKRQRSSDSSTDQSDGVSYNSTDSGSCVECQNSRYMDVLIKEMSENERSTSFIDNSDLSIDSQEFLKFSQHNWTQNYSFYPPQPIPVQYSSNLVAHNEANGQPFDYTQTSFYPYQSLGPTSFPYQSENYIKPFRCSLDPISTFLNNNNPTTTAAVVTEKTFDQFNTQQTNGSHQQQLNLSLFPVPYQTTSSQPNQLSLTSASQSYVDETFA